MRRNSFGQSIREQRRRLELTQQEVAHRISASPSYVALLESGRRRPSKKTLISIANAVGLDALELYLLANPGAREMLDHGVP
ncbi:MAG: helix-turn-helix transcriptional regulator, partial [Candidatus Binataceae bacterium]